MEKKSIILTPLGGGREIGANSYLLEWGETNILLDCGLNPRKTGFDALPAFDLLYEREIDAIIISHAHLDHMGSLTFLAENYLTLGGRIFLTGPTAELVPVMCMESVKQIERDRIPIEDRYYYHCYFDRDIVNGLKSYFSVQNYNQNFKIAEGITGSFFPAGHILGSAGIVISDGDYTLTYTGDLCRNDQAILKGCELPREIKSDCILIESTYGGNESAHEVDYHLEYKRLAKEIKKCIKRKGHVLLPSFALGRAQNTVIMLNRMKNDKLIPDGTPVYIHKGSSQAVSEIYDSNGEFLQLPGNATVGRSCKAINGYRGKGQFRAADELTHEPSIFAFTNGMMARGSPSARLAGELIREAKNCIFFTGYVAPNELGYQVVNSKPGQSICLDIENQEWVRVKSRYIDKFSFSAHAHREHLLGIAAHFQPSLVLWVHGEESSTRWLRDRCRKGAEALSEAPGNRESILLRLGPKKINRAYSSFRAVIVTVGTSLLTTYLNKTGRHLSEIKSVTREEVKQYLIENPTEISGICAETNSLNKGRISDNDYVYFICGENPEGMLCAGILNDLYKESHLCEMVPVKGLTPQAEAFRRHGMRCLIDEIVRVIERHDGNAVIHATGGFKAQIAIATLIGILFRLKVLYLYESFDEVVSLPEIPLGFNYEALFASRGEFFQLLDAKDFTMSDEIYARLSESLKHCFYKDDVQKKYNLTPLGRAMFNAFERQLGGADSPVPISVHGESALWGEDRDVLGKILNPMIGMVLERISRYRDIILGFGFSSTNAAGKRPGRAQGENHLELIKKDADSLTYRVEHISASKGKQDLLKIRTTKGMASHLLKLLGRKVYP